MSRPETAQDMEVFDTLPRHTREAVLECLRRLPGDFWEDLETYLGLSEVRSSEGFLGLRMGIRGGEVLEVEWSPSWKRQRGARQVND